MEMEKKMCEECHETKMIPENETLCKKCWTEEKNEGNY